MAISSTEVEPTWQRAFSKQEPLGGPLDFFLLADPLPGSEQSRHFYDRYILDFFVREQQTALDSLAATLKTPASRVTKSSLRKDPPIPLKKTAISSFIQEHPEIIEQYRQKLEQGPLFSGSFSATNFARRLFLSTVLLIFSNALRHFSTAICYSSQLLQ